MKPALLPCLAGLFLLPVGVQAETLPLPLSGPAYRLAEEASQAYARQDYDTALAKAREAQRQRPDAVQLQRLIDQVLHDRQHAAATPRPRAATVAGTPGSDTQRGYQAASQALRDYQRGAYPAATQAARRAVEQAPDNYAYRLMLIETLQRQQQLEPAHVATLDALAKFGPRPELLQRRQSIEAQQAVDVADLGYAALARGDSAQAVRLAREVVQLDAQKLAYRRLLVDALVADGQYPAARDAASDALRLNAHDSVLLVHRGQMRRRLGDLPGARQDFNQALLQNDLPERERAALHVALDQPAPALRELLAAQRQGQLQGADQVQLAYLLSQAGEHAQALAAFRAADRDSGLQAEALRDAAYSAQRNGDDDQAIAWFERVLDQQRAGQLTMSDQQVFDTRRAVADLARRWSLVNTTSYRGATTASGLAGTPGARLDSLQNITELAWRPLGYNNARFVELYGRVTDTLWSRQGGGLDALSGAVGVRAKPLAAHNVMLAVERTFPLGSNGPDGDWLLRLGYGLSNGTDLRVDEPSWWTSQLYLEAGRYLQAARNYAVSEWQIGRSLRLDAISPTLVVFPHAVLAADYDARMRSETDGEGRPGTAGGAGLGVGLRYWMRETPYRAPQSYLDLTVQYRDRIFGDDRAEGLVARLTYAW